MRGEEKPYEMPAPEQDQPPAIAPPAAVASVASKASETKQKISRQFTNNLAIQQRLQHLSPVHPQTLTVETSSGTAASRPVVAAASLTSVDLHKSPSAASTATSVLSSSSPASTLLMTTHHHHPLDSLLTPAASPEEDPLETWIHTVWWFHYIPNTFLTLKNSVFLFLAQITYTPNYCLFLFVRGKVNDKGSCFIHNLILG